MVRCRWRGNSPHPACPREAARPFSAEVHKQLETFDFRKPYRIGEVQSLGEKRAFRRIISRFRRSGVQISNEKSLLLLGLVASEFARQIHGLALQLSFCFEVRAPSDRLVCSA